MRVGIQSSAVSCGTKMSNNVRCLRPLVQPAKRPCRPFSSFQSHSEGHFRQMTKKQLFHLFHFDAATEVHGFITIGDTNGKRRGTVFEGLSFEAPSCVPFRQCSCCYTSCFGGGSLTTCRFCGSKFRFFSHFT